LKIAEEHCESCRDHSYSNDRRLRGF
jgi:hypothetical protein